MARNILSESETDEFRHLATAWFAVRERLPVVKSEAGQRSMMDAGYRMVEFMSRMNVRHPEVCGFAYRGQVFIPTVNGQQITGLTSTPLRGVLDMDDDSEDDDRAGWQPEVDDLPMYETKFPDTAALIANFKERSDDIVRVQVIPDVLMFTGPNGEQVVLPNAGMVIHKVNGHRDVVNKPDALRILADGILQRMRIKVEVLE